MTHFVETLSGYVNLAFVKTVQRCAVKGANNYLLFDADDSLIDTARLLDPEKDLSPIVAAGVGSTVTLVFTEKNPDNEFVATHSVVPVVAWRINGEYSEPILLEPVCGNEYVLHAMPDGSYLSVGDRQFENLDAAKKDFIRRERAKGNSHD